MSFCEGFLYRAPRRSDGSGISARSKAITLAMSLRQNEGAESHRVLLSSGWEGAIKGANLRYPYSLYIPMNDGEPLPSNRLVQISAIEL